MPTVPLPPQLPLRRVEIEGYRQQPPAVHWPVTLHPDHLEDLIVRRSDLPSSAWESSVMLPKLCTLTVQACTESDDGPRLSRFLGLCPALDKLFIEADYGLASNDALVIPLTCYAGPFLSAPFAARSGLLRHAELCQHHSDIPSDGALIELATLAPRLETLSLRLSPLTPTTLRPVCLFSSLTHLYVCNMTDHGTTREAFVCSLVELPLPVSTLQLISISTRFESEASSEAREEDHREALDEWSELFPALRYASLRSPDFVWVRTTGRMLSVDDIARADLGLRYRYPTASLHGRRF
jgi:hypothetical protein